MFETQDKFKFSEKKFRKIKYFSLFKLEKVNGTIRKMFKRGKLNDYKQHLGLSSQCPIVGFTPEYVGYRPSKPVFFKNIYVDNYDDVLRIGTKYGMGKSIINSLSSYREVWSGSPDSNIGHLRQILKPNRLNIPKAEDIIKIMVKCPWFKYNKVDFRDPNEIYYTTNINPKAHPGHYTSMMLANSKGYCIRGTMPLTIAYYNLIRKIPMRNYALWDVFSREKDIKPDSLKDPSTRVVLTTELHVTMIYCWVHQKWGKTNDGLHNWSITGDLNNKKINYLLKDIDNYDYIINPDDTFFDASNDTDLMVAAGVLMFYQSIDSKEDQRFFYNVVSSAVTKYICLPPGVVVRCDRGNPSGHPGVTTINCVLNVIRWSLVLREVYGDNWWEYSRVVVYGDDTYIMLKEHDNLVKIDDIRRNFGFIGDEVKGQMFPTKFVESNIGGDTPDFLKRRISLLGCSWNTEKIIDKLMYQSRRRSIFEQIELINNFKNTAPCDDKFNGFCIEISKFFIDKYRTSLSVSEIDKLTKMFDLPDITTFMPLTYFKNDYHISYAKEMAMHRTRSSFLKRETFTTENSFNWHLLWYLTSSPDLLNQHKKIVNSTFLGLINTGKLDFFDSNPFRWYLLRQGYIPEFLKLRPP